MSIETMKQALEALDSDDPSIQLRAAVALRQAIAEAEKQEPIFYAIQATDRFGEGYEQTYWEDPNGFPVYTAPVHASDISQECADETAKCVHEFEEMVKRGTKAWANTPDDWVDELRGGAEKREWVGLTTEEIDDIWKTEVFDVHYGIARMVEAKLKEKNT